MADTDERAHSEFLVLHQMAVDDIERAKQWAWTVAYYTVVAQGGTLALYATVACPARGWLVRCVLLALMLAMTIVSHVLLGQCFDSLATFRSRADRCRQYFRPTSLEILGTPVKKHEWPFRHFVWATAVVFTVLLVLQH